VTIDPLPDRPYFETVTLREPTDLRRFAAALGAPADEFKQLNAAWRAGHTRSAGAAIYVPTGLLDSARSLAERGVARAAPTQLVANTPPAARARGTRTHRVRNGDSLWAIAARHDVSVAALAAANGLPTRATLKLGQVLRLPAGNPPSAAPRGRDTRALAQNRTLRYKVRSGDSLWTISRQFKVTVEQLVAWNGLGRKHQLRPGQELQIRSES
jgi:membrane-bound lytic murein transglycosylase D